MWSLILGKVTLCVFYVLLLYCDVIVLSQRLRIYNAFETNDVLANHRSHNVSNPSNSSVGTGAVTIAPAIHRTKASEDSQYIHGMTYHEHKKIAAASEPYSHYRRYRYNAMSAPSVASWKLARTTTEVPTTETTTVAELPYSYFGTTRKPASNFDSDGYWSDRYFSGSRAKPTIRVESIVNSTFGQARIETGLKPRNPCCQNETSESEGDNRGKFRFYNSFSRDRGYAPYRAVQLVSSTTTSTTERPVYRWSDRYDAPRSSNQFRERASNLGVSSSGRVVGARENLDEWITTRSPYRYYTTTWVPRTTKERIENVAPRLSWSTNRLSEVDVEPYHSPGSLPRSGFDGVRGLRPWDDRPISTSTTTTTTSTRRPATLSGTNIDEYDYYDELEKRQTSTTKFPWASLHRGTSTTEAMTMPRSFATAAPRSNAYGRRHSHIHATTSTTRSPYVEYPPGPIYKPYEEDHDFKEWKSSVERKVQRIRRPSGKTKTPVSRMRVTGSPSLENDLIPLFKVSGVEEEDWKFIHETNGLEDSFQPPKKHGHERYRSEWNSELESDWRASRYGNRHEPFLFGSAGRTSRATSPTTTAFPLPPLADIWEAAPPTTRTPTTASTSPPSTPSSTVTENTTSRPKAFEVPTRRFVPRKPVVFRRRTTPRSRSGPKYSFRLFTPAESMTEAPSFTGHNSPLPVPSTSAEPTLGVSILGEASQSFSERPSSPISSDLDNSLPDKAFNGTPSESSTTRVTPTTIPLPSTTTHTFPTSTNPSTAATPSTTQTPTTAPTTTTIRTSSTPVEVHWLTTRKPVFGEGMSIEEQLAEAMRRLQERRKQKELDREKEEKKQDTFDGSGDWENEIANDAPIIVESVPEVADLNLRDDFIVEHAIGKSFSGRIDNAAIVGELVNEHVTQVEEPKKPRKSDVGKSHFHQKW